MTVNLNLDGMALQTNPEYDYLPSPVDDSLPEVEPYNHQIQTYETVLNNEEFLILNTSPTGGGKTYSWLAAAVEKGLNVVAMYPTNALIVDQFETVQEFLENYRPDKDVKTLQFTGDKLKQLREDAPEVSLSNAEAIERAINEAFRKHDSVITFTNPDIFTKLRHGGYGPEPRQQMNRFDMMVFDEFHLADTKGQNSLLYLFEDMYQDDFADTSKFMLLSATPEQWLADKIENHVGIPSYTIDCSTGRKPLSKVADDDGQVTGDWRAIMPAVDIEFRQGHTFDTASDLLGSDRFSPFLDFCQGGRTVVMLDALREVNSTYHALSREMPDGHSVYRIDGLHRGDIAKKLREFSVLISNSAAEVGIDFETDRLVFSGPSADSFLQRIGRLRAHSGEFETKQAICYANSSVVERMAKVNQTLFSADARVPRDRFERVIKQSHDDARRPRLFEPLYTALEMFNYVHDRAQSMTRDERKDYLTDANSRIKRHCFDPQNYELTAERIDELTRLMNTKLVDTLQEYRGGGMTTLMYDATEEEVKTYSLQSIIRHGDVEFLTESEFLARIPDEHIADAKHEAQFSIGYCIYKGERQFPASVDPDEANGRKVRFIPSARLRHQLQKEPTDPNRRPIVTDGLQVHVEDEHDNIPDGLGKLNEELADEHITCYAVEGSSYSVSQRYNLDDFFFLSELTRTRGEYTVAFGLNALYLHCHDRDRQGLEPLLEMEPTGESLSHP